MTTPYMKDAGLLESLRGQQYVVLRPSAAVAAFYAREQIEILRQLPASTPHPNVGHVTLRGLWEPDRVHRLRELIASWARSTPAVELRVEAVDGFPPPFSVLIARLRRTPSLLRAFSSLTEVLDATDFRRIGELSIDDWVFHLSLAYASSLGEQEWGAVLDAGRRTVSSLPHEVVSSVDLVWYDDEGEHSESFALLDPEDA